MQGQWSGVWLGDWQGGSDGGNPVVTAALAVQGAGSATFAAEVLGGALRAGVEFVSIPTWRDRLRKHQTKARVHVPRKARRKVKAIEVRAAALALEPATPDWKFERLAAQWAVLVHVPEASADQLFMARVRLQMERMEADEEDALMALLS